MKNLQDPPVSPQPLPPPGYLLLHNQPVDHGDVERRDVDRRSEARRQGFWSVLLPGKET